MFNTRSKKAIVNILVLALYQIILFVANLILPKLIISHYGSAYNGLVSSITQFLSFISILRLGIAGSTRAELYKSLANNDTQKTSGIIVATQKHMRKIALVLIGYIVILSVVFPLITDVNASFLSTSVLVVAIGFGVFGQYFFGITVQTLLDADQKQYIYNFLIGLATILNTILSVVLILNGVSIQIVKIVSGTVFFATPVILNFYVVKKYKIDQKAEPDYCGLSKRKHAMGHSIANIIHENTDVLVLTIFCDIKVVSVYMVYHLVMSGIARVLEVFTSSSESVFGNMWAKNEIEKIRHYLGLFEFVIAAFCICVFSSTFVLIVPFVSIYTNGVTDINYILPLYAFIITTAQLFYCLRTPYISLVQAAGQYKETKIGAYIEAALNLTISIVMVLFFGIVGTAIGTLIANIFRTIQYSFYVSKNMIGRSKITLVKRFAWIVACLAISIFLSKSILWFFDISTWPVWCLCGLISVFISLLIILTFSLVFYRTDLKGILIILKNVFQRKRKNEC